MRGYRFSPTEKVAHVGNLEKELIVVQVKYRTINQSTGIPKSNPKEGTEKVKETKIEGIEVEWWEDSQLKTHIFHAHTLVPWEIASKGKDNADRWLDEMIHGMKS